MKKSILIIVLSLSFFSLSAQHFYLGAKTGMTVNNGFNRNTTLVSQNWEVRSQHFFGAQAGIIARYETKGLFKPQLEILQSDEGNNFFIKNINNSSAKEVNVHLKRRFIRVNIMPNIGGSFANNSRWRFMGGVGISMGFPLSYSPTHISSDSAAYWPIDNIYSNPNSNLALLVSATVSWKIGVGILEFNTRYRQALMPSFETYTFDMPENYNKAIELNFSFIIPIKLDKDAI